MAWDIRQGWRAVLHPDQDDHAAVEGVTSAAGLPLHAHLAEVRRQGPYPHSTKLHSSGHRPMHGHQLSRWIGRHSSTPCMAMILVCSLALLSDTTPCMPIQNIQLPRFRYERCPFCCVKVKEYCKSPRSVDRV